MFQSIKYKALIEATQKADPPSRHNFEPLTRAYLEDPVARTRQEAELAADFSAWIAAEPGTLKLLAGSPQLAQAAGRARQLAEMGMAGLEAVSYLSSGLPANAGWKAEKLAVLNEVEKPQALVRFTVVKPLRDLVNAVSEAPNK